MFYIWSNLTETRPSEVIIKLYDESEFVSKTYGRVDTCNTDNEISDNFHNTICALTDACKSLDISSRMHSIPFTISPRIMNTILGIKNIEEVELRSVNIEDACEDLLSLMNIRNLLISHCDMSISNLNAISKLPLQNLNISYNKIFDAGFEIIARIRTLKHVKFYGCEVTSKGMICLENHPGVTSVDAAGNYIGDAGVESLCRNPNISCIRVDDSCGISQSAIILLAENKNLTSIEISYIEIDINGVIALSRSKSLKSLKLCRLNTTNEKLSTLINSWSITDMEYVYTDWRQKFKERAEKIKYHERLGPNPYWGHGFRFEHHRAVRSKNNSTWGFDIVIICAE